MIKRIEAKRSVTLEIVPPMNSNARKSFKEHFADFVYGEGYDRMELRIDGNHFRTFNPDHRDGMYHYFLLDDRSHTITLYHSKLKKNLPAITIPAGTDSFVIESGADNGYSVQVVETYHAPAKCNIAASPVSHRMADLLVHELTVGDSFRRLKNRDAWSMWLECWEEGILLGFFDTNESETITRKEYSYKSFCRGEANEYEALCIADAVALERWLMDRVKERLPKDSPLEIFCADQYCGVRCSVNVMSSPTTWELRDDFIDLWNSNGRWYEALHNHNVYRAQMIFGPEKIGIYFEGYPHESKSLPAERFTYYAGQAQNQTGSYRYLNSVECEELEAFLIRHIEDNCKNISISPIPSHSHCYYIIDNYKIYYEGQEPYW